ncbi:MAG: hypothetical protein WC554_15785 [Clostridia bacterium]|jgi:hypothetical protein
MEIELGKTYIDKITGFKGVATGYCIYISGCNQVSLTGKCKDNNSMHMWVDVQRVEEDKKSKKIALENGKTPGFDTLPDKH